MTCEAALIKLGWLLARHPDNPNLVRSLLPRTYGELTMQSQHNSKDAQENKISSAADAHSSDFGYESKGFLEVVFNALKDSQAVAGSRPAAAAHPRMGQDPPSTIRRTASRHGLDSTGCYPRLCVQLLQRA